jgi:hypothetical protein
MAQVSTGMGLAILGGCILGAAALTSHKFGSEAMAQGTGTERRIVSTGIWNNGEHVFAYRIWSDNVIDIRGLGVARFVNYSSGFGPFGAQFGPADPARDNAGVWLTVDNGTSGFRPLTDVDMSGETDAGDISQVLLDFNTRSEDLPPPPIDCSINSPR